MYAVAMEFGRGFVAKISVFVDEFGSVQSDLGLDLSAFMTFDDLESAMEICDMCLTMYPDNDFIVVKV